MTHPLAAVVESRFAGTLTKGDHEPDGHACLHEAINIARGLDWSDSPGAMPDLRSLNDAPWSSDEVRTANLLPVGIALWDWADWSPERRVTFAKAVAEGNIRTILPMALRAAARVNPKHAKALESAAAAESARSAAESAESAAGSAWSAWSAGSADEPLIAICALMVKEA